MQRPGAGEVVFVLPDWLHLPQLQRHYPMPLNQTRQGSEGDEAIAAWVDEEEDADDEEEDFFSMPLPKLLTGWVPSSKAARLYGWMLRKQQANGQTRFTINDLAIGRPLGKKQSHAIEVLQPLIAELLQGGMVQAGADRSISLNL